MRVCFLATGYPLNGADNSHIFVHRLARSLVKKGAEVHVIAPHAAGTAKQESMEGVAVHRFRYMLPERFQTLAYFPGIPENIKKPANQLQVPSFVLSMAQATMSVVRRHRIDLINAHWALPPGLLAVMMKKMHGLPVVTRLYGAEVFTVTGRYKFLKNALRMAVSGSDWVVANSEGTRQAAAAVAGDKEIRVIPEGADSDAFSPDDDGGDVRARHGLVGCPVVFSCGRMVERKGFEYLVRAMPQVVAAVPKAKLVLGGDGPLRSDLAALAGSLGVGGSVVFPGALSNEDMPHYYGAGDVFVLPSVVDSRGDTEGLGTTLIEAMASGKPIIGSNVGGIPYIIGQSKEYGFLVDQKDPEQLGQAITNLLRDKSLREKCGRAGRKEALDRFSWDGIADTYLAEFEKLIARRRGRHGKRPQD